MQIGPYQVLRELGRGGMGAVYLCSAPDLAFPLAVKVIRSELGSDEDLVERFRREGEALERLDHPHLVRLRGRGRFEGGLWLAMDYVEGESLGERLKRQGPLSSDQARALMLPLCEALAHAHAVGVLHRDLKPDNVLLRAEDDAPLVVDFGLALPLDVSQHLTRTGEILGSPGYLAPEQCGTGAGSSAATDVYGLGAILYSALCGAPPFRGASLIQTLDLVLSQRPKPPSAQVAGIDPSLEAICLRCLAKDPDERYPDSLELAAALRVVGRPPGRGRGWLVAGALGALAAGALVAGVIVGARPTPNVPAGPCDESLTARSPVEAPSPGASPLSSPAPSPRSSPEPSPLALDPVPPPSPAPPASAPLVDPEGRGARDDFEATLLEPTTEPSLVRAFGLLYVEAGRSGGGSRWWSQAFERLLVRIRAHASGLPPGEPARARADLLAVALQALRPPHLGESLSAAELDAALAEVAHLEELPPELFAPSPGLNDLSEVLLTTRLRLRLRRIQVLAPPPPSRLVDECQDLLRDPHWNPWVAPLRSTELRLACADLPGAWSLLDALELQSGASGTPLADLLPTADYLRAQILAAGGSPPDLLLSLYSGLLRQGANLLPPLRFRVAWDAARVLIREGRSEKALELLNSHPPPEGLAPTDRAQLDLERAALLLARRESLEDVSGLLAQARAASPELAATREFSLALALDAARTSAGHERARAALDAARPDDSLALEWRRLALVVRALVSPLEEFAAELSAQIRAGDAERVDELLRALVSAQQPTYERTPARSAEQRRLASEAQAWLLGPVGREAQTQALLDQGRCAQAFELARARLNLHSDPEGRLREARLALRALYSGWAAVPQDPEWTQQAEGLALALAPWVGADPARRALVAAAELFALTASAPEFDPALFARVSEILGRLDEGIAVEPEWEILAWSRHQASRLLFRLVPRDDPRAGVIATEGAEFTKRWRAHQPQSQRARYSALAWLPGAEQSAALRDFISSSKGQLQREARLVAFSLSGGGPARVEAAGELYRAPLASQPIRLGVLIQLAREHYMEREPEAGLIVLDRLERWETPLPPRVAFEVAYLRAKLLSQAGRSQEASAAAREGAGLRSRWLRAETSELWFMVAQLEEAPEPGEAFWRALQLQPGPASWRGWADTLASLDAPGALEAEIEARRVLLAQSLSPEDDAANWARLEALEANPSETLEVGDALLEGQGLFLERGRLLERVEARLEPAERSRGRTRLVLAGLREGHDVEIARAGPERAALLTALERLVSAARAAGSARGGEAPELRGLEQALADFRSASSPLDQRERDLWRLPGDEAQALGVLARASGGEAAKRLRAEAESLLKAWLERGTAPCWAARFGAYLALEGSRPGEAADLYRRARAQAHPSLQRLKIKLGVGEAEAAWDAGQLTRSLEVLDEALRPGLVWGPELLVVEAVRVQILADLAEAHPEGSEARAKATASLLRALEGGRAIALNASPAARARFAVQALFAQTSVGVDSTTRERARAAERGVGGEGAPAAIAAFMAVVWARVHRFEGDFKAALERAEEAVGHDERLVEAVEERILALIGVGRLTDARLALETAITSGQASPRSRARLERVGRRLAQARDE